MKLINQMKRRIISICYIFLLITGYSYAQEVPQAEIANETLKAVVYLPNAQEGYYRATRFDWSGIIKSLQFNDHEYFRPRVLEYKPLVHNHVSGPVDCFEANFGYAEAEPGGRFMRIGVGILEKPTNPDYKPSFDYTYKIISTGEWHISKERNWIRFVQIIPDMNGYRYEYTKRIELISGKNEMLISHTLKNTGNKILETTQYNHNFFSIDHQLSGPDLTFKCAFIPEIFPLQGNRGLLIADSKKILITRQLKENESVLASIRGFDVTPQNNDISIESRNTGAGVNIKLNHAMTNMRIYLIPDIVAPEMFINLRILPGEIEIWELRYTFYTLK